MAILTEDFDNSTSVLVPPSSFIRFVTSGETGAAVGLRHACRRQYRMPTERALSATTLGCAYTWKKMRAHVRSLAFLLPRMVWTQPIRSATTKPNGPSRMVYVPTPPSLRATTRDAGREEISFTFALPLNCFGIVDAFRKARRHHNSVLSSCRPNHGLPLSRRDIATASPAPTPTSLGCSRSSPPQRIGRRTPSDLELTIKKRFGLLFLFSSKRVGVCPHLRTLKHEQKESRAAPGCQSRPANTPTTILRLQGPMVQGPRNETLARDGPSYGAAARKGWGWFPAYSRGKGAQGGKSSITTRNMMERF